MGPCCARKCLRPKTARPPAAQIGRAWGRGRAHPRSIPSWAVICIAVAGLPALLAELGATLLVTTVRRLADRLIAI
jgi:hypothetical protein